ncbi:MAG: cyclic nucleotide-binding domain-containing protein, partial [Thermoleophilaceae bacterium]
RYPFAVLVSDMASMTARLRAVEAALAAPGAHDLIALEAANERPVTASSLLPRGGLATLADTPLPQRDLSASERRRARALGGRLRGFPPFATLSDSECTTLHGLLDELRVPRGATVVARGEPADALYLIERGEARVHGEKLRHGDCFGEIGLLTGGLRTADVVASTPLHLLRLSRAAYRRYLHQLPEVDGALGRLGLIRAAAQLQPT